MTPPERPVAKKPAAKKPAAQKAAARPDGARKPAAGRPTAARPGGGGGGDAATVGGFWRRVPAKELMQFTGRLETLVNAGLPLVRCLRILENQQKPGPLRDVLAAVAVDVEGGAPLSEAFAKYPQVFDRLYVNMVRAGEAGGVLGTVLARLASFSRKAEQMKGQVKSAMTYPVLVMVFAGGILCVTMIFVVPKFEGMFASYDTEMPFVTTLLLTVSRAMVAWWYLLVALPVLAIVGFRMLMKNETFAYNMDRLKLGLPIAGDVVKKSTVARFCRTLGTLLSSGVPILEALSIVQAAITNRVLEEAVGDVRDAIREGESMARPLGESGVFDDMVVNMIDVGEETGQLDSMLVRIADDYEDELDTAITVLFKALEPVMLLFVAVVVGVIAFALFSPMVKLMESFSG